MPTGALFPVDLYALDASIFSSAAVREAEFSVPRGFLCSAGIHTFTEQ
jgi:hypothetical protein